MKLIELYSLAIDGICILINSFKFTIEIDHRVCVCVCYISMPQGNKKQLHKTKTLSIIN